MKCSPKSKKREILTLEQAAAVFAADWENDVAKLANAVAFYTGMRAGEVAALRFEDIGVDRLYVRHSWRSSEGLKECKNGEEREVLFLHSCVTSWLHRLKQIPGDRKCTALFSGD